MTHTIDIATVRIGPDQPLAIIAGPCAAESYDLCMSVGSQLQQRCAQLGFSYIFKASFDKANRTSIHSQRGKGLDEGLAIIQKTGKALGVPTTTDIHESHQASAIAQAVDLIQIPAFLCRQTDLLVAAANTGKAVNVKKGQFLSPAEMANVITKLTEAGCTRQMLTERGTFFGYHRLVNDFIGLGDLMDLGWPVCFDVTHSTQLPGATQTTGGRPDRAPLLAKAAAAAGVHALFIETHPTPSKALSDAATMLPLQVTHDLLGVIKNIRQAISLPNSD
jgi:2-dehydro-3-deoxyphosphooctonate aldolase (KDO 8-P synthase)